MNNSIKYFLEILFFIIMIVGIVIAIDFIPQGNINLKGIFNITNLAYVYNFSLAGNINANNYNITRADNISAKHFYGDGSGITGITSNSTIYWANLSGFVSDYLYRNGFNLDINESRLNNSVIATAARFNETTLIFAVNTTANIQGLGFYTKAQIDNNLTLYLLLTDQRFNETALINSVNSTTMNAISSVNTTYNIMALGFYNKTAVDSNLSLYLLITDERYNETALINSVNSTTMGAINSVNATAKAYTDSVNQSQSAWIDLVFLKIADMFSKADITGMISGNRTAIETNTNNAINGNASALRGDINSNSTAIRTDIQSNWTDLNTSKLDKIDQRFNETSYINSNFYNKSANINAGVYNVTAYNVTATVVYSIKTCYNPTCTSFSNATGFYSNGAYIIYNGTNMVLKG
jgi:hypothetical protein